MDIWISAQWLSICGVLEWKGFMYSITKGMYSENTKVFPLTFNNSPPADYVTIYPALQFAADLCSPIVKFHQPLYIKGKEIVAAPPPHSPLSRCEVQLGLFHLLMSSLGFIEYIMEGSGFKELMSTFYAPVSVDRILQERAFTRAVQAHLQIQTALSKIILEHLDTGDEEWKAIFEFMTDVLNESASLISLNQNPQLVSLAKKIENNLTQLKKNGLTAMLWVL
ncbi:hypothetical protein PR048_013396 [Dryococelus australis]|uniref:Uncharacterized protein n=1 Tax=Dryococelus australis TaxID=614101 RepID=A0ABQ9HSX2_9NEOP|nr:hypothetical protein PR048_013396 [Dryococelus australis]